MVPGLSGEESEVGVAESTSYFIIRTGIFQYFNHVYDVTLAFQKNVAHAYKVALVCCQ